MWKAAPARWCVVVGATALLACGGDDDDPGPPPPRTEPLHEPASCADDTQAPLRGEDGALACTALGAVEPAVSGRFADATGRPGPVVYVAEDSDDTMGDGSEASPYATLERGLADMPGTVMLSRGTFVLAGTVTITASVAIVGAGADGGTVVQGTSAAIEASGTGNVVSVYGVGFEGAGVRVVSEAELVLEQVRVDDATEAIDADGATVTVTGVTVRRAAQVGLWLRNLAAATVRSTWIADGAAFGIVAEGSSLDAEEVFVTGNARDGVSLLGAGSAPHRLRRVSSTFNGVTALRAEGVLTTVDAGRLVLSGTTVPAGTMGGQGLYVADGAQMRVDIDITTDARRGLGSEIVGNAFVGALADGADTNLELNGALVGSNDGPGVVIQNSAVSNVIGYGLVEDNAGLGIATISHAEVLVIPCNDIRFTREAAIATATVGTIMVGDGLSMGESTGSRTMVEGNVVTGNARFGMVFFDVNATVRNNTGSENRWGIGSYGTGIDIDASNSISGSETPPATEPPTPRGGVSL